jgi:hypothetical protein
MTTGRIHRLMGAGARVPFHLDGAAVEGAKGDTVLTAILSVRPALRQGDFGPEMRAGFCLMGACQDCWVWQEGGPRLRACSTMLVPGMRLRSAPPAAWPGDAP